MTKRIVAYAAIEDSDKPEHPCSLIGAFVVRYRHARTDFMRIPNTDRTDRIPLVTVFAGSTRNRTYVRYVTLCLVYCVKFSTGLLLL